MRVVIISIVVALGLGSVAHAKAEPAKRTSSATVQKASDRRAKNSRKPKQAAKSGDVAAIKQRLIQDSIASYRGNCPCPYNKARDGSECGRRSAYSRPGGAAPLCYAKDVTDDMVREYRNTHKDE